MSDSMWESYVRIVESAKAAANPPREILITTRSGRCVNVLDLRPEDIKLEDIALGLSRQARYLGQTVRFYSVAEHSILVRDLLAYKYPDSSPLERRLALLHDAGEAYTGDIVTPYKEAFPQLARLAKDVQDVVERALGLENAGPWAPIRVAECDAWARNIEACLLFKERPPWAEDVGCPRHVWAPVGYDPHEALAMFRNDLREEGLP